MITYIKYVMIYAEGSQIVSVDCLISSSAIDHIQSENREFVGRRPDESIRPDNPIPLRLGQRGASNEKMLFN
jgi:hypothetical protein